MLMLIQSLIFRVNVYFPESTQARPDTRQHIILKIWSVIFWQGPAPHDLWWCSDFTSCCVVRDWEPRDHNITCNLLNNKYNTDKLHKLSLPANQRINMTFNFWSKATRHWDRWQFQKDILKDFWSRYEEYDQIMRRMNRSIICTYKIKRWYLKLR